MGEAWESSKRPWHIVHGMDGVLQEVNSSVGVEQESGAI